MKINHNVVAAMLMGLMSGALKWPRSITQNNRMHTERARPGSITQNNRMHTERARPGSPEASARIAAAEAKRQRKAAKRCSHSETEAKS